MSLSDAKDFFDFLLFEIESLKNVEHPEISGIKFMREEARHLRS